MLARKNLSITLVVAALAAGAAVPAQSALAATSGPRAAFTQLTLTNGWEIYEFGAATPAVTDIDGIVYFKGNIDTTPGNPSMVPFTMPAGFQPSKYVSLPTNLCVAVSGELFIAPTGVAQAISSGNQDYAQCSTSLDGLSYALSTASFTPLKLGQGWQNPANTGRPAGARLIDGVVHFEGEIKKTGKNPVLFTLPPKFRPATNVYLHVNMCTGGLGQLSITPKGVVREHPEQNFTFEPKCGLSLDGASFVLSSQSFVPLKLINGWKTAKGTATAAIRLRSGFVQFRGAISSTAGSDEPFVLPAKYRPSTNVYVNVDLCDGNSGRLYIPSTGVVSIVPENNDLAAARCLTSLEGTWYAH
jgi:hypothetical protein